MAFLDNLNDTQKGAIVDAIIAFRNLWNSGRLTDRQRGTELLGAVENLRAVMNPPDPVVYEPPSTDVPADPTADPTADATVIDNTAPPPPPDDTPPPTDPATDPTVAPAA